MPVIQQKIVPHLWYDKEALEAAEFYCSIFPDSHITSRLTMHDTPSGDSEIVSFILSGQPFQAISAGPYFKFNEAISFIVNCETQAEIDYYWEKLSADPGSEQCGWLKDKYGLSWQIVPTALDELVLASNPEQLARLTQSLLQMKKLDLAALRRAYDGS